MNIGGEKEVNGNENPFAIKVPISLEVADAVTVFMAFANEPMAGAWTNEYALAAMKEDKKETKVKSADLEDPIDCTLSRCW